MPQGATFLKIESLDPLAARFSTLWYTNDMSKQWQSNDVLHAYYRQLKVSIESFPCMTPHTLNQYRPLEIFFVDAHFIYINTRRDESKEELQSYYKLTDDDMEHITKEWSEEFLVPIFDAELSDTNTIGSPLVTQVEHVKQSSGTKKKKKKEEIQDIETDEEENASEENGFGFLGGGGDQEDEQGGGDEGEKQGEGEATKPQYPPTETITLQKRKVSPKKPSAIKKMRASKP
jgi:hypothetical protein